VRSTHLLLLVLALLAVTAVASPWVAWGVMALLDRPFTFSRVYNRVFEVLLVVGLALTWRRLDLGTAAEIGLRRRGWWRQLGIGLRVGFLGIGLGLVACALLGALDPELRYPPLKTVRKAALGAGAAVIIGIGEEVLFRGVLLRRLGRDFGVGLGVVLTTAIYAMVHAIGRGARTPLEGAWSGVEQTAVLFAPLADPAKVPDLAGLTLLGLVLAAARLRTGGLWMSIGIHAAWVAVFRIGRLLFEIRPWPMWLVGAGWPPLVGGAAGWLAAVATGVLLLRASRARPRTSA